MKFTETIITDDDVKGKELDAEEFLKKFPELEKFFEHFNVTNFEFTVAKANKFLTIMKEE